MRRPLRLLHLSICVATSVVLLDHANTTAFQSTDPYQEVSLQEQSGPLRPKINDIVNDYVSFLNQVVSIEGIVTQHGDSSKGAARFFYLKDDAGGLLVVRTTAGLPAVGLRYRFTGPVSFDPLDNRPFLSEDHRERISADGGVADQEIGPGEPKVSKGDSGYSAILIIFLVLVAASVVGGVTWFIRRKNLAGQGPLSLDDDMDLLEDEADSSPPDPEQVLEDKTTKIFLPPTGTMKIMSGRFVVEAGLTTLPELRFFAPKGGEKQIAITFGRASGQPYRHVQLKLHSVSSMQAKLVIEAGAYELTNFASEESNPTTINGRELAVSESVILQDGDRITMGEVEFTYKAN